MTRVLEIHDGRVPLELPARQRFTREEFERAGDQPFAAAYALVERRTEGDPISPTAAPAGVIEVVDLLLARR
jgi:hypothetical protein